MRWSELRDKEIIDISDGERLGAVGESELVVDEKTGSISTILVPSRGGFFSFGASQKFINIPWASIEKVGPEVIIVETNSSGNVKR